MTAQKGVTTSPHRMTSTQGSSTQWTADDVAFRFAEAFRTIQRLPAVKMPGYSNSWPSIIRTRQEIAAMTAVPTRFTPSPDAITRLEELFDWVLWVDEAGRRLIWSRAARLPWIRITDDLGCDRTTAWRRWRAALSTIAKRLNA